MQFPCDTERLVKNCYEEEVQPYRKTDYKPIIKTVAFHDLMQNVKHFIIMCITKYT